MSETPVLPAARQQVPTKKSGLPRKRLNDELAQDAASEAGQQEDEQKIVAAQADQARGGAGGDPSAEGNASAGAGLPALGAVAAGGGAGTAALAGAGALGLAAAGGGGGGGGSASTTAATSSTTTTASGGLPPPTSTGLVGNFTDYLNAVNGGGATPAANAAAASTAVDISGGFSRSVLPQSLSSLRSSMNYSVANANVASINDGGMVVDLTGASGSSVAAHANAGAGTSQLLWMQTLRVTHFTGSDPTSVTLSSTASGAGADAEIGVQHLRMDSTDAGSLNAQAILRATGSAGGGAHTFAGDVGVTAVSTGAGATASSFILITADGTGGSIADVAVAGNVSVVSQGENALTRAAVHVTGTGTAELGAINVEAHGAVENFAQRVSISDAFVGNAFLQVTSEGAANVNIGSVGMVVDGGARGWVDLYSDHGGGLTVGSVNLTAGGGSLIQLDVHHSNHSIEGGWVEFPTFIPHEDGVALSIATLNVHGTGTINALLNGETFGTINKDAGSHLLLHTRVDEHAYQSIAEAQGQGALVTLNGFNAQNDAVDYSIAPSSANFASAGSFATVDALNAGLNAALDGTHKYVFATFNGSGVLAFDNDGAGMTSVLMLPGVTTMTATDLA